MECNEEEEEDQSQSMQSFKRAGLGNSATIFYSATMENSFLPTIFRASSQERTAAIVDADINAGTATASYERRAFVTKSRFQNVLNLEIWNSLKNLPR